MTDNVGKLKQRALGAAVKVVYAAPNIRGERPYTGYPTPEQLAIACEAYHAVMMADANSRLPSEEKIADIIADAMPMSDDFGFDDCKAAARAILRLLASE